MHGDTTAFIITAQLRKHIIRDLFQGLRQIYFIGNRRACFFVQHKGNRHIPCTLEINLRKAAHACNLEETSCRLHIIQLFRRDIRGNDSLAAVLLHGAVFRRRKQGFHVLRRVVNLHAVHGIGFLQGHFRPLSIIIHILIHAILVLFRFALLQVKNVPLAAIIKAHIRIHFHIKRLLHEGYGSPRSHAAPSCVVHCNRGIKIRRKAVLSRKCRFCRLHIFLRRAERHLLRTCATAG